VNLSKSVFRVGLVVTVLLGSGCAARSVPADAEDAHGESVEMALEVENHNWSDIVIYLMRGSQSHRGWGW